MRTIVILVVLTLSATAQGPHGGGPPPGGTGRGPGPGGGSQDMFSGKWWTSPEVTRRLGLSEDQQHRIEQIFQQSRLQLIDLRATLEKEEALLDPMLASDHPTETSVLAQIDRIANARAELEKANARMLFSFRLVLTPDQWKALQSRNMPPPNRGRH